MNNEIENHIKKRYNVKNRIGVGAYGIVWKAVDKKTGQNVALKKIFDAFKNETDAQRTFREIAFLQEFSEHPNIIQLINVRRAENDKDIYLIFELMESDLHNIIKRGNLLQSVHKQFIMYQILKALKYIHSGNVIHRDLKPSNVLLDSNCVVKLCDFGLTRSLQHLSTGSKTFDLSMDSGNPTLTEYVATRWYRAPEILLGSAQYSKSVDMWSTGCILAEMLLGKPLFTGSSSLNQIEKIVSALPRPTTQDIESIKSNYCQSILSQIIYKPGHKLENIFPTTVDPLAFNLMVQMLHFNPSKRPSVEQSLEHDYVEPFHDPELEIVINHEIIPPISDETQLSIDEYRQKLYDMIVQKKQERLMRKMKSKEHSMSTNQESQINPINSQVSFQANSNNQHSTVYPQSHSNKYNDKPIDGPTHNTNLSTSVRTNYDLEVSNASIAMVKQSSNKLENARQAPRISDDKKVSPGDNYTKQLSSTNPRQRHSDSAYPPTATSSITPSKCHNNSSYTKDLSNPTILRDYKSPSHMSHSWATNKSAINTPSANSLSASGNKVPMRARPQSSNQHARSNSATFGRKQFDNMTKNSSIVRNPALFGSYSQKYGTMSNSKLQDIYSRSFV